MALKFSETVRNAQLDAVETAIGTSAVMKIRSGAPPADCGTADSGDVLATLALPENWMDPAAAGAKAKAGTWGDTSADLGGTAGHYRIYASDGTTVHAQGTVTLTAMGGDLTLDNTNIAAGQAVSITSFSFTAGNA